MSTTQEYIQALEDENRFLADLLKRMATRNTQLTEQRNLYWKKVIELRKEQINERLH
jgi:hypothetical protein